MFLKRFILGYCIILHRSEVLSRIIGFSGLKVLEIIQGKPLYFPKENRSWLVKSIITKQGLISLFFFFFTSSHYGC